MAKTWTNTAVSGAKITSALLNEIKGAIDSVWCRRGTANTSGSSGTTITLSPVEASANYDIYLTWNVDPGGDSGQLYVLPADKLAGSFVVRNQGASGISFTWLLMRQL